MVWIRHVSLVYLLSLVFYVHLLSFELLNLLLKLVIFRHED